MKEPNHNDPLGPVESGNWPDKLPAHVMSPDLPRRSHGYTLLEDLARHYDFAEVAFTILAGTPPTGEWGTAVNLAFIALSGISIADAPVHAATLSRRSTAPARVAMAIGMLGLAEQADHLLSTADDTATPDEDARTLWADLPPTVRATLDRSPPTAEALAVAVLRSAGLKTETQLIAAISLARLPALAAEVDAVEPGDVRSYPMRLPDFRYEGNDE